MIQGTGKGMVFHCSSVPLFPGALDFAEMGLVPGGTYRNREFRGHQVDIDPAVSPFLMDILFDPQTSGGLLIAVPREKTERMLKRLHEKGIDESANIGEVVNDLRERIVVMPKD